MSQNDLKEHNAAVSYHVSPLEGIVENMGFSLLSTSLIFRSHGIHAVLKFSKSLWNLIHFWP